MKQHEFIHYGLIFLIVFIIIGLGFVIYMKIFNNQNCENDNTCKNIDLKTVVLASGIGIALVVNLIQLRKNSQTTKSQFWLELEKMFYNYDDVHVKLRKYGLWYNGREIPKNDEEWARVDGYMILLVHANAMIERGTIGKKTFDSVFKYRLENILTNHAIIWYHLISKDEEVWGGFHDMLKRAKLKEILKCRKEEYKIRSAISISQSYLKQIQTVWEEQEVDVLKKYGSKKISVIKEITNIIESHIENIKKYKKNNEKDKKRNKEIRDNEKDKKRNKEIRDIEKEKKRNKEIRDIEKDHENELKKINEYLKMFVVPKKTKINNTKHMEILACLQNINQEMLTVVENYEIKKNADLLSKKTMK